jgi:hypothetical protein
MKVKTNLSPGQLELVADKLQTLAKSQRGAALPLENPAEKELMRRAEHAFDAMLESLQTEVARTLLDKD